MILAVAYVGLGQEGAGRKSTRIRTWAAAVHLSQALTSADWAD